MNILRLFIALCLMSLASTVALAASETINFGPASISLDLESIGSYTVEKGAPSSMDHKRPDFLYEIIPASITSDSFSNQVSLEVHQMSMSVPLYESISKKNTATGLEHCIEKSEMMPVGEDMKTENYTIDGHQGLLATINKDPENPLYIVAYSPDLRDGSGRIVCIVGSDLPWETTKSIFDSVSTNVA